MSQETSRGPEHSYAWVMVAVASVYLGVGNGSLNTISVFLLPVSADLGWLRGQTAFAFLAGSIALGMGGILMGYLSDRFSTRPVVLVGALFLGPSMLLLARQSALWQFYLLYFLLGGLGFAPFNAPLTSNVGGWFSRNKGLAIGSVTAGRAIGNSLVPFLGSYLITVFGWRAAYTWLGSLSLVLLLPLVAFVRSPPAVAGPAASGRGGATGAGNTDYPIGSGKNVVWLGFCAVFCCFCMAVPLVHVVALARDRGFAPQSAALIFSVLMVAGIFGSVFFGRVADRIGLIQGYMLASAWQTATVLWFPWLTSLTGFFILAVLFGFGYSGVMTCLITCVQGMSPAGRRGLSTGTVSLFAQIGMGLGGYLGGLFFDLTGDYKVSFALAAIAGLGNLMAQASFLFYFTRAQAALTAEA